MSYEGEGKDGYRDQIVTCDVGVSLHSKTHASTVHEVQQGHKHTVLCIALSELVSCAFSTIPICPFLIQRIFHSLVSTLFLLQIACLLLLLRQPRIEFPNVRGEYNL